MSWSYSGDPADSPLDYVRFKIGDTDTTAQLLQDDEILLLISETDSTLEAASVAATAVAAKFSRGYQSKSVGDLSINYGDRVKRYMDLAVSLMELVTAAAAPIPRPYAGGISEGDKLLNEDNIDVVQPAFKRGQHSRRYGDPLRGF